MAQGMIPGAIMVSTSATNAFFGGVRRPAARKKRARKRAITRSPSKRTVSRANGPARKKRVARRAPSTAAPARMVKGSAAAKRHMARLRGMQKKAR